MSSQDQPPKRRSSAEQLKAQDPGIIAIGHPLTPSECAEAPSEGQGTNGASSLTSLQALDPSIIAVRHATLSASQNNDSSRNISPNVSVPLTFIKSSSRDQAPQQAPSSKKHESTGLNQDTTVPNPSAKIENVQKQKRSKKKLGKQRETMTTPNNEQIPYTGYRTHDSWNAEEIAAFRAQKKDSDEKMKRNAAIARYKADVRARQSDLTRADIARDAMVAQNGYTQAAREAYPPPMFPPGGMVNPYLLQYPQLPASPQFPIQQYGYYPNTNLGNDSLGLNPMARDFVPGGSYEGPYGGPVLPPTHNPNPPMNGMSGGHRNGDYYPNRRRASSVPPMNSNDMVGGYENGNHQSIGQPPMNQQINPDEWRYGVPYGGDSRQHIIPAHGSSDYGVPVPSLPTSEQPIENGNGMTGGYTNGNHYSNGQPPMNGWTEGYQNGGPYSNGNSLPSQYLVNGNGTAAEYGNYENGNHVPNGGAALQPHSTSTSTSTTASTSPTTGWASHYEDSYQSFNVSRRY